MNESVCQYIKIIAVFYNLMRAFIDLYAYGEYAWASADGTKKNMQNMMTSWNGNTFYVIFPLCGETTAHQIRRSRGKKYTDLNVCFLLTWISFWTNYPVAGEMRGLNAHVTLLWWNTLIMTWDESVPKQETPWTGHLAYWMVKRSRPFLSALSQTNNLHQMTLRETITLETRSMPRNW